jgi:hypothetical protein
MDAHDGPQEMMAAAHVATFVIEYMFVVVPVVLP